MSTIAIKIRGVEMPILAEVPHVDPEYMVAFTHEDGSYGPIDGLSLSMIAEDQYEELCEHGELNGIEFEPLIEFEVRA